ncbi:FecR domain-containing protein [Pseudomonas denitrificans (nom. rej.)]|nr:FecR domain-containing protein [Pseudomonas denitrificans (nom. rej.)]
MREQPLDPGILGEAADWLVRLNEQPASNADLQAIEQWRARSAQHAEAWRRAEALLGLRQLPPGVSRHSLQRSGLSRRQMLNRLGVLMAVAPAVWLAARQLPWAEWNADLRTAVGERKHLRLPDGSQLTLNTDSAVNVAFNGSERRLSLLEGEILVEALPDPRPFLVGSRHGLLRTPAARFGLRDLGDACRVAVLDKELSVELPDYASRMVSTGQQLVFGVQGFQPLQTADANASAWENGMLLAQGMRLDDLLGELGRYRSGFLRCDPRLANLRVTGAIPLGDSDAGLALLADMLPVKLRRMTRYWVTVEPA